MWLNTEVFMEAGRALREEEPVEIRVARAQRTVGRDEVVRQPRLARRLLQGLGALLISSGQRLQAYGQSRGYTPLRA